MKNDVHFSLLFTKYLENRCSADEADQLLRCLKRLQYKEEAILLITQQIKEPVQDIADEAVKKKLQERLQYILEETEQSSFIHRIHFLRTAWFRWTSAAAIIVMLGAGILLYTLSQSHTSQKSGVSQFRQTDIAPGRNRAILTLADGSTIILDNAANGKLAQQGNTIVTKQNDQIIYGDADNPPPKAGVGAGLAPQTFNTMTTPRGGQYQLTLPDGTKVWLNAVSSITYPTAFTGKERNVSITGEAYFEVAEDKSKPFFVTYPLLRLPEQSEGRAGEARRAGGGQVIEVLGTHFNVHAYTDESDIKISLLEGSVKIGKAILKPGQAYLNGKISVTNVEQDVAWKNGKISLTNSSVEQVMQDISRWYDVDIKYNGTMPSKQFYGSIHRNVPLSSVLNALKAYGVNTKLEGKTIIVE